MLFILIIKCIENKQISLLIYLLSDGVTGFFTNGERVVMLRRAFHVLRIENISLRQDLMAARTEIRRLTNIMYNFNF